MGKHLVHHGFLGSLTHCYEQHPYQDAREAASSGTSSGFGLPAEQLFGDWVCIPGGYRRSGNDLVRSWRYQG
jgi:hypothetical protein